MTSRFGGYEEQEFVADLYDSFYDHLRTKDINFFISYSQKSNGRTLELGCGTGRVLMPVALSGCEITGLDLSPYMLKKCQQKLDKQTKEIQERVRLVQGNMTDFETGETYTLVTIPFQSFQLLISVDEQKACLEYVNRHLLPGGILILDLLHTASLMINHPKYLLEREYVAGLELPDGCKLRCTTRIAAFHRDQQFNDVEIIYYVSHPDGRTERLVQAYRQRYFYRYEVEYLLDICGFRVTELLGDYDGTKYAPDSPEMIFIAEKT